MAEMTLFDKVLDFLGLENKGAHVKNDNCAEPGADVANKGVVVTEADGTKSARFSDRAVTGTNLILKPDGERLVDFAFLSLGQQVRFTIGFKPDGELQMYNTSHVSAELANKDLSNEKRKEIIASVDKVIQKGRLTEEDADAIQTLIISSLDPKTLAEARGEGVRVIANRSGARVRRRDRHLMKESDAEDHSMMIDTDKQGRLETIIISEADNTHVLDVSGSSKGVLSAKELRDIQAKWTKDAEDGFIDRAEVKNLGNLVVSSVTATPSQDKSPEKKAGRKH